MTSLRDIKSAVVSYARKMAVDRLVTGTSGNVSCLDRDLGLMAITPSGVNYECMAPDDISIVDLQGVQHSGRETSTEMPLHLALYRHRSDVHAIVHTHSMYATTFAILGEPILAVHYMVTVLGGDRIPITPQYALFGTEELAQQTVATLNSRYRGVLIRNHGVVTVGKSLFEAYRLAVIVEEMAELYYHARSIGNPHILDSKAVGEVLDSMRDYGQIKE